MEKIKWKLNLFEKKKMKKRKIELISRKVEDEVDYLLFLEKHSDCLNLFNINGLLDTPSKMVKILHQSRAQMMVYLILFEPYLS